MGRIFEAHENESPLLVSLNCPSTQCNYRCSYCYLTQKSRSSTNKEAVREWQMILNHCIRIQRPLYLAIGTYGEPLLLQPFWKTLREIMAKDKIVGVWFPSNLSLPLDKYLHGIPVEKLGIVGTLHPSQFGNFERDFEFFFKQCLWLKEHGSDIVVNYVLTPDQIESFFAYKEIFAKEGIGMTANIFKGSWDGKNYPESYTEIELQLIEEVFENEAFIYDYMSQKKSSLGAECTAGRYMIHIENDGIVYSCPFSRVKLGRVTDNNLTIYDDNHRCSTNWCKCHWTIGFIVEVVRKYKRLHGIFSFEQRPPGEAGSNPFQ
jgi:MoaA/NifB/PqqE/SkfB family radical SAM enzyme